MRPLRALGFTATFVAFPALAFNSWSINGPTGGKVNQFVADPAIPSTVYAATQNGLFRSTDAGQHWIAAPAMLGTEVDSVGVSAADPTKVFAATFSGLM